jgi:hypothetical protein
MSKALLPPATVSPTSKLFKDRSPIAQMSMAEARNFAHDILTMCSRTEADARCRAGGDQHQYSLRGSSGELSLRRLAS